MFELKYSLIYSDIKIFLDSFKKLCVLNKLIFMYDLLDEITSISFLYLSIFILCSLITSSNNLSLLKHIYVFLQEPFVICVSFYVF
jgi:hypothetical protein